MTALTYAKLALAFFNFANALILAFQKAQIYQDGRNAALAEMDEEQRRRIAAADAARADADAFTDGSLRDLRQRD